GNCYYNYHKMSKIEDELFDFLKKVARGRLDFDDLSVKKINNKSLTKKYNKLKVKLDSFNNQFDKLIEAFQGGVITMEQLKKYKAKLEKEKKELKKEMEQLKNKIENQESNKQNFYTQLKGILHTLDNEKASLQQKQNALTCIIDEIQISDKKDLMKVIFKV
ncbi:MAG: hypothetical protein ACOCV3_05005, partial [Halanaerobiales bacterium]